MHFQLKTLSDILRNSADLYGDNVAVDHDEGVITYSELQSLSFGFARQLQEIGVTRGDRVPLLTTHGTRNIVALLGILIAGACYVPMDRGTWSEERIQSVLNIVKGSVLVNTTPDRFEHGGYRTVHLRSLNGLKHADEGFEQPTLDSSSLACIIFTSGSTGRPKGVMIPHGAVANYAMTSPLTWTYAMGTGSCTFYQLLLMVTSTGMLFSILYGAGTIVPASKIDLITKAQSCSIIACTPSILATLPPPTLKECQYPDVHTILLGGETIPQELIDAWCFSGRRILNAYGPTETTCASLMHVIESSGDKRQESNAIIGKAMPNAPVYLLDSEMRELRESGQEGEIVISGPGVTHGYFEDEEKTNKAFINRNGRRMYRTGDYGMWTKDSRGDLVIEFRGRKDRVVKNRGFLVNLDADIETPMSSMGFGIQSIHVAQFRKKVIALVCPETVDTDSLRRLMLKTLSSFMVPDRIMAVQTLPMTANGKVDPRGVLQMLEDGDDMKLEETTTESDAPGSEVWFAVKDCARRTLGLGNVALEPSSNIFSHGASSLDVLMFVSLCQKRGYSVTVQEVYSAHSLDDICRSISAAAATSQPNDRASGADEDEELENGIIDGPVPVCAPMTPLQLELAGPTLAVNGKNTNRICIRYDIQHADTIEEAWHKVWRSEPIFRTKFLLEGESGGTQHIEVAPLTLPTRVTFTDYSAYKQASDSASLCVGLGTRLDVLRFVPEGENAHRAEATIVWTAHHSLIDGYAMAAILAKVEAAAAEASVNHEAESFMVVARRLVEMQEKRDSVAKEFWSTYLRDAPFIENLGLPRPRVDCADVAGEIRFSSAVSFDDLRKFASENQVTFATVLYTAWAMTISKYTNQDTVTVGAVVSGRESPLVSQASIGPTINTLPLVVKVQSDITIREVLRETLRGLAEITGLGVESFENTAFPLNLLVEEGGLFRLVYDPAVYGKAYARDIEMYFQRVLEVMVKSRGRASSIPPTISEAEETLIMREWNPPTSPSVISQTLQGTFAKSLRKHADLRAVECVGESLTYRELDSLASKVALKIRSLFPPAKPIAIHADGSLNWIVGILGILKSGSPYCPLDPQYPLARRAAVCTAAGAVGLLLPSDKYVSENPLPDLQTLIVSETIQDAAPAESVCFEADPATDALIVFTSGTTGAPKGVPISHRGLLSLQSNPEATMFSRPGKRIAQMMSPAFDYCSNEIFSALLHGATLVLRDPTDPYAHLKSVDTATLTPSLMAALDPHDYSALRTIYATGEPVTPGLVQHWAPGREFYNAYGPAEGSICVSFTKLVPGQDITIGRAIRTARMYILDKNSRHQPVGALGELYLAGVQVTRGYLNAEELTKLRYLPDPWFPGEMMYRTGDFCRWTRDGNVFYVGRLDRQVKIRGFRIELPSVEQTIYAVDPLVVLVNVLAMDDTLIAVVKPACIDTVKMKKELLGKLPPSWVPQRFVATDNFPLTQNKKIDMVALKDMLDSAETSEASAPEEAMEGSVAEGVGREWKNLLKIRDERPLGASDRFTELGGHSILQMLLSARLSARFQIRLTLRDVLQADTLQDLVELVKTRQASGTDRVVAKARKLAADALSPVEEYQWSEYKVASSASTSASMFNINLVLNLQGDFSREALVSALNKVLAEHEIYRSNYVESCGRARRTLRSTPPRVREQAVLDLEQEINYNFKVCEDELIRIHLWGDKFVLVVSHMIADLNSLENFFNDVSVAYNTAKAPSMSMVQDYISLPRWEQPPSPEDSQFWVDYMKGAQHQVPLGKPSTASRYVGQSETVQVPPALAKSLGRMAQSQSVTRHHLALAAVALALRRITQKDDLVLGAPCSCRVSVPEQQSMGLLLDRLPVRIGKIRGKTTTAALLSQVRKASQAALAHVVPFPELLRILGIGRDTERHPVFEVMVTFHLGNGPSESIKIPNCTASGETMYASGSKFLIMFEWTEHSEEDWSLRIEYNTTRISPPVLAQVKENLWAALDGLAVGADVEELPLSDHA
ncbi:NRPS [Trichoderma virens FT-333]|nr:NRPS [Trichoderma virens FT-333]